jgi:hypothetical protein
MSSVFDPIETHIEEVGLALPITPDWLEKECKFTFTPFVMAVANGGSLMIHIHEQSNAKIYMFRPHIDRRWTIKVYINNILWHHQYVSTRRDFMDVVAKLRII